MINLDDPLLPEGDQEFEVTALEPGPRYNGAPTFDLWVAPDVDGYEPIRHRFFQKWQLRKLFEGANLPKHDGEYDENDLVGKRIKAKVTHKDGYVRLGYLEIA